MSTRGARRPRAADAARFCGARAAAAACLLAAACDVGGSAEHPDAAGAPHDSGADAAPSADAGAPGATIGSFQLTYYWVTAEQDFTGAADTTLYDSTCATLATVPAAFASSLDVEGTGRLADGRVVNVSGTCPCLRSPCYDPVDAQHPWGSGVQDRALVPYRTVAVDPSVIPYGKGLYLQELDGVALPGDAPWGGFVDDGCVVAGDTGGAIIGQHVDFFVGLRAEYQTLDGQLGLTHVTVHDGGARCPSM